MTDLQNFSKLMKKFKVEIFEELDEYECVSIRLENNHYNSIPLFYFDKDGKFISVDTAIANGQCQICGKLIY